MTALARADQQLGVSRRKLARLLQDGVLTRLSRSLVVGSCVAARATGDRTSAHLLRLSALLATYPECVASHESAALLHGLPLLTVPDLATATRPRGAWRGGAESRVRVSRLPPHHLTHVDGSTCTTVARSVVDIARTASLRESAVAGDAALQRRLVTPAQLDATLAEVSAWADVGRARKALAFFDGRAESPLESVSRVIMQEYDVPPPTLQRQITLDGASFRVDFLWEEFRTIGEADGRVKYTSALEPNLAPEEIAWREKVREDALRDAGYRVVRWTYWQMLADTERTMARLKRRLTR